MLLLALLASAASPAWAQTGRNVLLVVNAASEDSRRIGQRYAAARGVPADQLIELQQLPAQDEISARDFQQRIERPLASWFTKTGAQDRILYIVLTRGVPLRIAGSNGLDGTMASVDSELTLLYRRLTGKPAPTAGRIDNPYYLADAPITSARPFSHETFDIFLVTRLDGFTVDDVLGVIERGRSPVTSGTFVLDMKGGLIDRGGNAWLRAASTRLAELGHKERVLLDESAAMVTSQAHVLGYYSWGSNDPTIHQRTLGLQLEPGALAAMFVSTDGRTFAPPPDAWTIGTWERRDSYYAGSPQSLAGDLIRAGATGVAAHVAEPYLDATIRPQVLFPAYVRGLNLAESFYLAMPYVSWQTVVIGDPLCAPFARTPPARTALEPVVDASTELPAFFSARRLAIAARQARGMHEQGLRFALQGETRLARGDTAGGRQAFEAAVLAEPRLDATSRLLAGLYEQDGQYERAADVYRRILTRSPDDIIVLNNLAFLLATRLKQPKDGLPLAQRAYTLANGAPLIADTYGWVLHLTGDHAQATTFLRQAVAGAPAHGEVRLHYAVVLAATGQRAAAQRELAKALDIDPTLASRGELVALQRTLAEGSR